MRSFTGEGEHTESVQDDNRPLILNPSPQGEGLDHPASDEAPLLDKDGSYKVNSHPVKGEYAEGGRGLCEENFNADNLSLKGEVVMRSFTGEGEHTESVQDDNRPLILNPSPARGEGLDHPAIIVAPLQRGEFRAYEIATEINKLSNSYATKSEQLKRIILLHHPPPKNPREIFQKNGLLEQGIFASKNH